MEPARESLNSYYVLGDDDLWEEALVISREAVDLSGFRKQGKNKPCPSHCTLLSNLQPSSIGIQLSKPSPVA